MVSLKQLFAAVAALSAMGAGTAYACPAGGGDNQPVAIEPEFDEAEELLLEARTLEQAASREDSRARTQQSAARKQRQLAAGLRERARLFPELDTSVLLAKARVADREAALADARAKQHSKRSKQLRARALELRALAKKLAGFGDGSRIL
jgi:hypothetical protein